MPNPKNNPENLVNGKYYDISQIKNQKNCHDNLSLSLSLIYLNTCSLSKIFDDFKLLFPSANINFDVTTISESRVIKNKPSVVDINLSN